MKTCPQHSGENRAAYMMRVAAEFIREHCPEETIHYDEAECDGYCLADDLEDVREAIS